MKRINLVAVVAITLIVLVFAYSQSTLQSPQTRATAIQTVESQRQTAAATARITIEREVGTQQRINRYFHGEVVSKLKNCWSNVQGKGMITLKYTFTKTGARWTFSRLGADRSTLPRGQDSVAEKCMLDAVHGTSFQVDGGESTQNTFVLSWTWPVPFPANALQLTSAMFAAKPSGGGSGGGGCDGHGAAAKCYACKVTAVQDLACETVCVGYENCSITYQRGGSKTCGGSSACASGGPFGVVGGSRVIY